jgi:hypothetical protein
MHYWSKTYREAFLVHLRDQNGIEDKCYQIDAVEGPSYVLDDGVDASAVRVICLEPAPFARAR